MKPNHLLKFSFAAALAWLPCCFAQLAPFAPEGRDPLDTLFSTDVGCRFPQDAPISASPLMSVISHRGGGVVADDFTETFWPDERLADTPGSLAAISARLFSGEARMLVNRAFFNASSAGLVEGDNFVSRGLLNMSVAGAIRYTAIPAFMTERD